MTVNELLTERILTYDELIQYIEGIHTQAVDTECSRICSNKYCLAGCRASWFLGCLFVKTEFICDLDRLN